MDGETFFVGNGKLMEQVGADWHECHMPGTVVHIARGKEYLGHIVINDQLKPDAGKAIASLKKLGVKQTVLLSGDREKVAKAVAESLGLDMVCAELLPEQKVEEVERLLQGGAKLAFVGDGINDAPVLARADVGISPHWSTTSLVIRP